jgi:peptide/nickel transport system substrate-binding protein/oligopeptide transport system substrate-binding protein
MTAAAGLAVLALVVAAPAPAADDVARELTVAYSDVEVTLDPLHAFTATEAQLFTALSEGLVSYHPVTLDPVPGVAHTWHVSDDGLRYRFLLRDNARFSDGTRVVAGDFRASWLRIINPGEQAEYSLMFDVIRGVADYRSGANSNESAVGIRVISEGELEVVLERPAEHFLSTLAHHAFAPVYPAYRAQVGWERQAPIIGNGPFSVTEWQSGELVFERNPHYWARSTVELDRIRIRFLGDADAIDTAFMAGTIHWANHSRFTEQLAPFIVTNRLFGTTYFVFRSSDPPFDDVRVRRALALMVPWEEVRNRGRAYFPTSVLVPGLTNYPEVAGITAEDERTARRLLEQAGFEDGNGLPPVIIKVAGAWAAALAATIETAWESRLGLDVTVAQVPEYDDYLAEIRAGNFTLTISSWIGDFTDPISFLQMWTTASNLNDAGYASRDYDRMIDRAIGSTGLDRLQMLAEAEELLLQDAVILPVSHLVSHSLIDLQRIAGWTPNLLDIHPFRYLGFRRADLPAGVAALSELVPG